MKILEHYRPAQISEEKEQALISVLVAAYNSEAYIEKCLLSICGQTYSNLEIIVIDDESTDKTGKLCDKLAQEDRRIQVVHRKNGGLASSRNEGMERAKGEYIAFMDGDDWIDPDMYETMLCALLDQNADVAICRYRQVYKNHTNDGSVDRAVLFEGQEALQCYVEEREEYRIQNAAWNKLFRREAVEGILFPVERWYEDIPFTTAVLARAKRCIYLDTAYHNYIIDREGSMMNRKLGSRIFTDLLPTYYNKTRFLQELGRPDLADIHDYFIYKRLLLFYNQIKESDMEKKEEYLRKISDILYQNREHIKEVFACEVADTRDYRNAMLFLRSPEWYWRKVRWNEKVVIPLKIAVKKCLKMEGR